MSTVSTVLATLRIQLDESSANEWTDAELIADIANAEQELANRMGLLFGSGRFRYRESITLAASTEAYALSSLTKRFAEMIDIMLVWNGEYIDLEKLNDGEDATVRGVVNSVPGGLIIPKFALFNETIKFLPLSGSARTIWVIYRWLPTFKTSNGESLETPQQWDPWLVLRAYRFANTRAGQSNAATDEEYQLLNAEMERTEQGRSFGSRAETVRAQTSNSLFM